jgi:hypothetical protein
VNNHGWHIYPDTEGQCTDSRRRPCPSPIKDRPIRQNPAQAGGGQCNQIGRGADSAAEILKKMIGVFDERFRVNPQTGKDGGRCLGDAAAFGRMDGSAQGSDQFQVIIK